MRVTLDLRSFDDFDEAAFASLWLDTEMHRWSRESHEQLDLPKWGVMNLSPGETHLCGQAENDRIPLVHLEGLDLDQPSELKPTHYCNRPRSPHEGASGRALMCGADAAKKPSVGRWSILYLDYETTRAEHSNFADDVS